MHVFAVVSRGLHVLDQAFEVDSLLTAGTGELGFVDVRLADGELGVHVHTAATRPRAASVCCSRLSSTNLVVRIPRLRPAHIRQRLLDQTQLLSYKLLAHIRVVEWTRLTRAFLQPPLDARSFARLGVRGLHLDLHAPRR